MKQFLIIALGFINLAAHSSDMKTFNVNDGNTGTLANASLSSRLRCWRRRDHDHRLAT